MAWIESHSVLVDHRKVRECAAILGIKKVHLIGHLHCFWHKVIDLAEDGVITDWTAADVSYYSQWEGDPEIFYNALKTRFIDEKKCEKVVHDWLEYAWKYLYRKYHTANPKRLEEIQKLHLRIGKPKRFTKGDSQVVLPNQPNLTNQPNQPKEEPGAKVSAFVLPEWVKPEDWSAFEEMRKKIKKPMTDRARENIVSKLADFKSKGHDPTVVLNNSITGSWQDVYEPKPEGGNGNGKNGRDNRSFFERDVAQREQAKLGARALLGVPGGGSRLASDVLPAKADGKRASPIHGEIEHVPEVEIVETG